VAREGDCGSIGSDSPAEVARLDLNLGKNRWESLIKKASKNKLENQPEPFHILGQVMSQRPLARLRAVEFVVLLVVGLVFLAWAYNHLKISDDHVLRDFIQLSTSVVLTGLLALVSVVASIFMAQYAYETVDEMRNDRKKDMIEKRLEKAYSPLYGILEDAKNRDFKKDRLKLPESRRTVWFVDVREVRRIENILMSHRHYLSKDEATTLGELLRKYKTGRNKIRPIGQVNDYYLFNEIETAAFLNSIETKLKDLSEELTRLAGNP
jgi:hypothetical protein